LLTAVENADPVVADTLTNDQQYTVFAPTNDAFADFFDSTLCISNDGSDSVCGQRSDRTT
jgi:uncharacterized surface protein with fasciclin (FAS1) repeats